MIKVKIADLMNSEIVFMKIKDKIDSGEFEFGLAYKLTRLLNKISSELKEIYNQRNRFLEKYGEKDEKNPDMVKLKEETADKATKIWDKFLNTEIELDGVSLLSKDEVNAIGKLNGAEIMAILPFADVDKMDESLFKTTVPSIDELDEPETNNNDKESNNKTEKSNVNE